MKELKFPIRNNSPLLGVLFVTLMMLGLFCLIVIKAELYSISKWKSLYAVEIGFYTAMLLMLILIVVVNIIEYLKSCFSITSEGIQVHSKYGKTLFYLWNDLDMYETNFFAGVNPEVSEKNHVANFFKFTMKDGRAFVFFDTKNLLGESFHHFMCDKIKTFPNLKSWVNNVISSVQEQHRKDEIVTRGFILAIWCISVLGAIYFGWSLYSEIFSVPANIDPQLVLQKQDQTPKTIGVFVMCMLLLLMLIPLKIASKKRKADLEKSIANIQATFT